MSNKRLITLRLHIVSFTERKCMICYNSSFIFHLSSRTPNISTASNNSFIKFHETMRRKMIMRIYLFYCELLFRGKCLMRCVVFAFVQFQYFVLSNKRAVLIIIAYPHSLVLRIACLMEFLERQFLKSSTY